MSGVMQMLLAGTAAVPSGQQEYYSYGTYSFVVPASVTSVSAMVLGGGGTRGGGGGGCAYGTMSVTPGETLTVVIGRAGLWGVSNGTTTSISRGATQLIAGLGGANGNGSTAAGGAGGSYSVNSTYVTSYGGGNGGNAGTGTINNGLCANGGGGAAGYTGNGGNGGSWVSGNNGTAGTSGSGGGAGGGGGGSEFQDYDATCDYYQYIYAGGAQSGGSLGIYGQGTSGGGGNGQTYGALSVDSSGGGYGSGGLGNPFPGAGTPGGEYREVLDGSCTVSTTYSAFNNGDYYSGAARIIWGTDRAYPSTNTANV